MPCQDATAQRWKAKSIPRMRHSTCRMIQGQINEARQARTCGDIHCIRQHFGMSSREAASRRRAALLARQSVQMPFYSLVPPQSKISRPEVIAWVPVDDNQLLCILFSYHHPNRCLRAPATVSKQGIRRETGHPSRHASSAQCHRALPPITGPNSPARMGSNSLSKPGHTGFQGCQDSDPGWRAKAATAIFDRTKGISVPAIPAS